MHGSKLGLGKKVCFLCFFFLNDAQGFKIEEQRFVLGTGCRSQQGLKPGFG